MHKKFEINWTKIKGGCQSGRKVVTYNSKSDLPLDTYLYQSRKKTACNSIRLDNQRSHSMKTEEGANLEARVFLAKRVVIACIIF